MIVTIEAKSKPCPGVEQAVCLAEDLLVRKVNLYTVGQLIHNQREVKRLEDIGLHVVDPDFFVKPVHKELLTDAHFLVRAHGEEKSVLDAVMDKGLHIVDATCPIVRHSRELIDQHVREGWGIIIVGKTSHPEVKALMDGTGGRGIVITSMEDAGNKEMDDHSLLIAQTTIDPDFFSRIRQILSKKLKGLKTVDTTCRFLRDRQLDIKALGVRARTLSC
jgi:(E)-4-hydroxy-3-methyl-but-2-enyl pyrophosphate reductase